jgi:exopolysaccharide/PEP-CTERM locus tyrosine autokinase
MRGSTSKLQTPGSGGSAATTVNSVPSAEVVSVTGKARRVAVDVTALRAAGCVAEESQGRLFAGQYREIKRQLIAKALSVKDANSPAPHPLLIMVTSALPGDGKTFTSINLALSLARERDVSVMLVDADVQKSDVSRLLGIRSDRGLMDALVDDAIDIESCILRTNLPGLTLLPAGTPIEGATELLSSQRMRDITESLVARNPRRIVLLDSPPLLITTESRALMKVAGQIVLVVRSGKTPRRAVQDALRYFDERQAVGLVLNDAQRGITEGYYGYGYYGYEYGATPPKR